MVEQKIISVLIVEVAGRPPEYLTNSLKLHVEKMNALKGARVISSKISSPKKLEAEQEMYTIFVEVEVETDSLSTLISLVMDFMPSSVEILSPSYLEMDCQSLSMFFNDIAARLHKYDEIAKLAKMQIEQLALRLKQVEASQRPQVTPVAQSPYNNVRVSLGNNENIAKKKEQANSKKVSKKKINKQKK